MGLAVFKKKAVFLDTHMEIAIGQTRPRGLEHQHDVQDSSEIESESESSVKLMKK